MPTNAVVASDSSSWHLSHPATSTVYRQHSSTPRRLKQRQRRTRNSTPKQQAASSSNFTCPTTLGLPLLGDSINVVVVTDIHGWIAGQHARHEPQLDVDFGDLVSFYERLQECSSGSDWFLLFNGDFMDGTGLSTVPPEYLAPLLQQVPFSALNVGNHELYFNGVVDYMMKPASEGGFIASWGGNYLASNVDYVYRDEEEIHDGSTINTTIQQRPFGNRFTFLHGRNSNTTILTFGFLYNFIGNCNHTRVRQVEDVLEERWFVDVLTKKSDDSYSFDAIIVLAHMDAVDPLVFTILQAIRSYVGPIMPIQFLTGHSHRRHYEVLDPFATSLEAGRYMDTVGYVSFPVLRTVELSSRMMEWNEGTDRKQSASLFQHKFLNANMNELTATVFRGLPGDDFSTPQGRALTAQMQQTQRELGLLDVLTNCAPRDYELARPINDTGSLWWLYVNEVVPKTLFPRLTTTDDETGTTIPIFLQGTGALRYSLTGPTVVVDDIIAVTPFENPIYQVGNRLTAQELDAILDELQVDEVAAFWESVGLVNFGVAGNRPDLTRNGEREGDKLYGLYTVEFHLKQVSAQVQQHGAGQYYAPRPLYTSSQEEKQQLETTQLWMDYARDEWKCREKNHDDDGNPPKRRQTSLLGLRAVYLRENHSPRMFPSHLATLSAVFLVVLVALESIRRRRRILRQQLVGDYEGVSYARYIGEMTPLLSQQ